jgi:hypothetical protein
LEERGIHVSIDKLTGHKALIMKHLKDRGALTALEALGTYRIYGLHQRISELKKMGFPIESVCKVDPTGKRYASYEYVGT